jgi:hypothetical protein
MFEAKLIRYPADAIWRMIVLFVFSAAMTCSLVDKKQEEFDHFIARTWHCPT